MDYIEELEAMELKVNSIEEELAEKYEPRSNNDTTLDILDDALGEIGDAIRAAIVIVKDIGDRT